MRHLLHRFSDDQAGVTAIEFGVSAGLIVPGIVSSVTIIGTTLSAKFFGPVASGFS